MIRRWSIPLTTAGLVLGSLMALGGTASAAPAHPAATHAAPAASVAGFQPGGLMARPAGASASASAAAQGHGARTTDQSTNWSGYAATGANGAFKSISASWKEPTATCSSRSAQYASFWVGLDGFTSSSVEQTGTDSDCSGRTPQYYGWYEMFPANPVNFTNPVSPGDSFTASVTFSGTATYTLVLKDTTKGWTQTITKNQSGLARSSAEVITEAPSSSSGVLPLANFGTISYSASAANGTSLASQSPTEIIMIDSSNRDKDSTSAIGSGGAFSNTWIRAN
ncbi:MAG TPA: G1 family glutamic endopeptidase [Streptosporangiaceae bacterium]|nr:G1 family glutamic endopeptidase [Streptosporangiaceae bacterium]